MKLSNCNYSIEATSNEFQIFNNKSHFYEFRTNVNWGLEVARKEREKGQISIRGHAKRARSSLRKTEKSRKRQICMKRYHKPNTKVINEDN